MYVAGATDQTPTSGSSRFQFVGLFKKKKEKRKESSKVRYITLEKIDHSKYSFRKKKS